MMVVMTADPHAVVCKACMMMPLTQSHILEFFSQCPGLKAPWTDVHDRGPNFPASVSAYSIPSARTPSCLSLHGSLFISIRCQLNFTFGELYEYPMLPVISILRILLFLLLLTTICNSTYSENLSLCLFDNPMPLYTPQGPHHVCVSHWYTPSPSVFFLLSSNA